MYILYRFGIYLSMFINYSIIFYSQLEAFLTLLRLEIDNLKSFVPVLVTCLELLGNLSIIEQHSCGLFQQFRFYILWKENFHDSRKDFICQYQHLSIGISDSNIVCQYQYQFSWEGLTRCMCAWALVREAVDDQSADGESLSLKEKIWCMIPSRMSVWNMIMRTLVNDAFSPIIYKSKIM